MHMNNFDFRYLKKFHIKYYSHFKHVFSDSHIFSFSSSIKKNTRKLYVGFRLNQPVFSADSFNSAGYHYPQAYISSVNDEKAKAEIALAELKASTENKVTPFAQEKIVTLFSALQNISKAILTSEPIVTKEASQTVPSALKIFEITSYNQYVGIISSLQEALTFILDFIEQSSLIDDLKIKETCKDTRVYSNNLNSIIPLLVNNLQTFPNDYSTEEQKVELVKKTIKGKKIFDLANSLEKLENLLLANDQYKNATVQINRTISQSAKASGTGTNASAQYIEGDVVVTVHKDRTINEN